ncbi:MAG: hypothetical protein H6828_04745 [Planctomycetes bacterium]|nr:hypothetical protein [Planctomycetota bacterium]
MTETPDELASRGSVVKPPARSKVLPDFRKDPLDGSRLDRGFPCVNLAASFVAWCHRHELEPRQEVGGALQPIEGRELRRTIEANGAGFSAGEATPPAGHVAVRLGPGVYPVSLPLEASGGSADAGVAFASKTLMAVMSIVLPNFRNWIVSDFVAWCTLRGLVPLVTKSATVPGHTPTPSEDHIVIASNHPDNPPGSYVGYGDEVTVILSGTTRAE